jgi:ribonucleoside-diphosphate reductase alpha chain
MRESAIQDRHTTSVTIGGESFELVTRARGDGSLGEVSIQWGPRGTTGAGLMQAYAIALSVGLRHRVPLVDLVRQGLGLDFVPSGHTDDPEIPRARSAVDYVARRIAIDWLPYPQRAELGVFTVSERVTQARTWMDAAPSPEAVLSAAAAG